MGGPLSETFSNIYLAKLEIHKVRTTKSLFCKRFVDEVTNKKKKNKPDLLLTMFNKCHSNINFTVGSIPPSFLIPMSKLLMVKLKRLFTGSQIRSLHIGHPLV